ncbi:MAG: RodZ domain-containing protein [Chlorobiota bacterium]
MGSLGERLRARRQELGLSLYEISQTTKIRLPILQALEANELSVLPAVYMHQFARRYGEFLNIPSEELQQLLEQHFGPLGIARSEQPPRSYRRSSTARRQSRFWIAQALIYGGLVGIVVAVVYYFFQPAEPQQQAQQGRVEEVIVQPVQSVPTVDRKDTIWRLRAVARDTVWLSIVVDGRQSEQTLLQPGQEREWFVERIAMLSVGNAGGVELWRNSQRLPPLGPAGSVVRSVRITADSVWSSATPSWVQGDLQKRDVEQRPAVVVAKPRQKPDTVPVIAPAPLLLRQQQPEPPQRPLPPP